MGYNLSSRSMKNLEGVDTNLVKVVQLAIQLSKQDFMVLEGVRSREQCMVNYGKGRTVAQCTAKGIPAKYSQPKLNKVTWLNNPFSSKHCYGKAVDLVPYPIDWNDRERFCLLAGLMIGVAERMGYTLRWGGAWNGLKTMKNNKFDDLPHFEII